MPTATQIENPITVSASTPIPQTTPNHVANKPIATPTPKPTSTPTITPTPTPKQPNKTAQPSTVTQFSASSTLQSLFEWTVLISVMIAGSLVSASALKKWVHKR
jgi:hypothetical protein